MDIEAFRQWSHRAADWAADYRAGLRERPVRSPLRPGEIAERIAVSPPEQAEPFERIFADFESIVPPGMTHWQHPRFFAYFPSNAAPPAVIAEQLAAAMSTQGMLWQTSPAATELEQRMVDWLRQAVGLPEGFSGVLQDTASSATLCAVLTMRETALAWDGNRDGLAAHPQVRIYTSPHAHSSVEKACWIAGIGARNLVQVPTRKDDPRLGIDPRALEAAIAADRRAGFLPAGIVACVGATSIGASDPLREIAAAAKREDLYLHVDAAWAGSAMICPEFREMWDGIEEADSIVFNPHKWLGVPMECSAHFVRDPETLVRTLAIQPEYLKTHGRDGIVNFSEWSVQLGRRFRALKLWFLVRAYGLEGLRTRIRDHVAWAGELARRIAGEPDFELTSPPVLSLFSFRYTPAGESSPEALDALNQRLLDAVNDDGTTYLTSTRLDGRLVIRFQVGPFDTTRDDVEQAWQAITRIARSLPSA